MIGYWFFAPIDCRRGKEGKEEEEEERNKAPPSNHEFQMEEERRFVRLLRREIDGWMDGEQPFAGTLALLTHAA